MSFLAEFVRKTFFIPAYQADLRLIRSYSIFNALPFHVHNNEVKLTKNTVSKFMEKANLLFSALMCGIYCIRVVVKALTTKMDITQILLYVGWTTLISCVLIFKLEYFKKRKETVLLFNGLHDLERKHIAKGTKCKYLNSLIA